MNKIKYSLLLVYMLVSFLKNSVKIINVQKYFGLYIEQIIIHCVSFFHFPEYLVGHLRVMGTQGRFSLGGPDLHMAEHQSYLEPFCKHWFLPLGIPESQHWGQYRLCWEQFSTVMEKPFKGLASSSSHLAYCVALFSDRLTVLWAQGWQSSFTIVFPMAGAMANSEDFQKLCTEWMKGQRQHLKFHLLSYLAKSIKRVGGDTWLAYQC